MSDCKCGGKGYVERSYRICQHERVSTDDFIHVKVYCEQCKGGSLEAQAKARRCVEAIEAERKPRKGILQYENACNHAINIIRREFGIEEP